MTRVCSRETRFHPGGNSRHQATDSVVDLPELLSVRQAAEFLGIGVSTLYAALAEGRVPVTPIRVGRTMKLPRRGLERWLSAVASRCETHSRS